MGCATGATLKEYAQHSTNAPLLRLSMGAAVAYGAVAAHGVRSLAARGVRQLLPGRHGGRATIQTGGAMRNYGIIGTLVVIILIILVLKLLGVF